MKQSYLALQHNTVRYSTVLYLCCYFPLAPYCIGYIRSASGKLFAHFIPRSCSRSFPKPDQCCCGACRDTNQEIETAVTPSDGVCTVILAELLWPFTGTVRSLHCSTYDPCCTIRLYTDNISLTAYLGW